MIFKTEPYAHQLHVFERFKDRKYFGLFADMGTGKTKMSIDIAAYKWEQGQIAAMVVIAPNHVHEQWVRTELPKHCPVPFRSFVWDSGSVGRGWYDRSLRDFTGLSGNFLKVIAFNVEAFQSDTVVPWLAEFLKSQDCFIVIDEATRVKNPNAKRSKTLHKLEKYGQRAILTGTPTAKSPFDLWSMMEILKANYFGCNFFIFQRRYGILMRGVNDQTGKKYDTMIDEKTWSKIRKALADIREMRGGKLMPDDFTEVAEINGVSEANVRWINEHPVFARYKRLEELRDLIKDDVYTVRKEDCLDLPPKIYAKLFVDMSKEQRKVYRDLQEDLVATYQDRELTVANKIALTTRLMQVAGGFFPYTEEGKRFDPAKHEWDVYYKSAGQMIGDKNPKLEALLDDLEEVPEDAKIIVWCAFVPELKLVHKALSKLGGAVLFYGEVSDRDRTKAINDFVNGSARFFVGNTATAGFGLNLQVATYQYFFSNTFRTEERLQAEDRSHRIGVKSAVVYKDIVCLKSIDVLVAKNMQEGKDLNDFFRGASALALAQAGEEPDKAGESEVVF